MRTRLFLLVLLLLVGSASAALDTSLDAYWSVNSTNEDATGNANDLTLSSTTYNSSGVIDDAINFDGSLSSNADTGITVSSGDFSIAGWVYIKELPSFNSAGILSSVATTTGRDGIFFGVSDDGWRMVMYNGNSGYATIDSRDDASLAYPQLDTWYHYVIAYDSSTENVTMYVNGTYYWSDIGSGTWGTQDDTLHFGTAYISNGNYAGDHTHDEMAYWTRTLNESESSELYNTGSGFAYPFGPPPNSSLVTLTAVDAYDGSSLSEFNATVSNSTFSESYTTTNGTIITNVNDTSGSLFNISFQAEDYFANTSYDVDVSSGSYQGSMAQAFVSFSCSELYTNDTLTCAEAGPFPRKAGNYTTQVNVTGYFPQESAYTLVALGGTGEYRDYTATPSAFSQDGNWDNPRNLNDQDWNSSAKSIGGTAYAYFNYTGTYDQVAWKTSGGGIAESNVSIPSACQNNPQLRVRSVVPTGVGIPSVRLDCYDGSTWTSMQTDGYTGSSFYELAIGSVQSRYTSYSESVIGFYDYYLDVDVKDFAGNTEENFNITLSNSNLSLNISENSGDSGLNSSSQFELLAGYTYLVSVNATSTIYDDPVNQEGTANITNTTAAPANETYTFNLSAARAVSLTYYWEENLTSFTENVTSFFIPTDSFNNLFFTTTSNTGNDTLLNLPVGTYIVEMVVNSTDTSTPPGLGGNSGGFHDEERFIFLTSVTGSNITGYFRSNTTGDDKSFNVVNSQSTPQNGWYVRAQRYYNGTGWITVDESRSNIDGQADLNLLSEQYYRVLLLNEDFDVVYSSERTLLPESQYEISPSATSVVDRRINQTTGVGASISVETAANESRYFETVLSTSGSSDTFRVDLYKRHSDGLSLVSSQSVTSSGATIISWIPNETGRYVLEAYKIGSQYTLASQGYEVGFGSEVLGIQGVFFSIFLLLAIIGTGVFSASAAIVLSILGLVVSSAIGLFSVQLTAIVGIAIVGGMILLKRGG